MKKIMGPLSKGLFTVVGVLCVSYYITGVPTWMLHNGNFRLALTTEAFVFQREMILLFHLLMCEVACSWALLAVEHRHTPAIQHCRRPFAAVTLLCIYC